MFTAIRKYLSGSTSDNRPAKSDEQPLFYQTLAELPFLLFERCMVHKEYAVLLQNADRLTLAAEQMEHICKEQWFDLYSQYCEATGDRGAVKFLKLNCEITVLTARVDRLSLMVAMLRVNASAKIEKIVSAELLKAPFKASNEQEYSKMLDRAESRIKNIVVRLNELIAERDQLAPKGQQTLTEQYYTDILLECSKMEGYRISKKDISALDFCSYLKRLTTEAERAKQLTRKGHRK